MNVYDFDKTIYHPDSSCHFFLYCLKRFPKLVRPALGRSLLPALRYRLGRTGAKDLKEHLFSYLSALPGTDQVVADFWKEHEKNLQPWYLQQKREDDLIVSASPDFLLRPVAEKLGVRLIATPMDPASGRILGENCHDEEKVRRLREEYPDAVVDCFYSDSLSDAPLAKLAKQAFLVRRGELSPWPAEDL